MPVVPLASNKNKSKGGGPSHVQKQQRSPKPPAPHNGEDQASSLPFIPKALASIRSGLRRSMSIDEETNSQIQRHLQPFLLEDDVLRRMMTLLAKEMEHGLSRDWEKAEIKMLPSYVRSVPNGTEYGNFLALDLGGTNFRVLLIKLRGKEADMSSKIFRVPTSMMVGTGEQLFDHIASCMASFMKEESLEDSRLPLGFTFSFPCTQDGLTSAKLITWTKGFSAEGVEGHDVVQLLQDAVKRRGDLAIHVMALLNDTTGTLMALAHQDNLCNVGVIVGTGTNACYMEKISRIPKLEDEHLLDDGGPDEIIINTEWGAFGSNGCLDFLRTPADREVDRNSINPGKQIYEKMISGMYLGELTRLVLEQITKDGLLFDGEGSDDLFTRGKFPTKFVSEIVADYSDDDNSFMNTINILDDLGVTHTMQDCANVAYVCSAVSTRAAYMCAAGIAVLLNRMQKPRVTVGVDGSVYRFHPTFKSLLREKIGDLIEPHLEYSLKLSEDGSGRGAALVAAVATRMHDEKEKKLAKEMEKLSVNNSK